MAPTAAILIVAATASVSLPASLAQELAYLPYVALVLGAAISLWFHRGHAFLALVSLLIAYGGYHYTAVGTSSDFATRAVFAAVAIFVPLNILLVQLSLERGVFHYRSYRWILLLVVQVLLTAWIASAGHSPVSGTAWHALLNNWLIRPDPTPFIGRLLLAAAISVAIAKSWERQPPLDVAMAGALVAFFIACLWPATAAVFAIFMSASGIILLLAVLQESHRMAFRDELTGLFGRRALEEQLFALGPVYAIAMVDVDHFKRFNDTHGHDVGDHVLRLIGAQLSQIGGGGRAFRYGGEEFSVLFPNHKVEDVLPYLEELRDRIQNYKIAIRSDDRRKGPRDGPDRRSASPRRSVRREPKPVSLASAFTAASLALGAATASSHPQPNNGPLSVTVSIGVAEGSQELAAPTAVIRAADQALYRAKHKGRNQVSR